MSKYARSSSTWVDVSAALGHIERLEPGIYAAVSITPMPDSALRVRIRVWRDMNGEPVGLYQAAENVPEGRLSALEGIVMGMAHNAYWQVEAALTSPADLPKVPRRKRS